MEQLKPDFFMVSKSVYNIYKKTIFFGPSSAIYIFLTAIFARIYGDDYDFNGCLFYLQSYHISLFIVY